MRYGHGVLVLVAKVRIATTKTNQPFKTIAPTILTELGKIVLERKKKHLFLNHKDTRDNYFQP